VRWTVLIPVKSLPGAKSRLLGASADVPAHHRLVLAMRADTIAAARDAAGVARVVLVVDRPVPEGGPPVFVQTRAGLNEGLAEAAADATRRWPDDGVAALVADLPALRAEELATALAAAESHERAFVPDAAGTGTTLLAARAGSELRPRFGPGSALRHARLATRLDAGAGLRRDVDTAEDLRALDRRTLGPATAAELDTALAPARHHVR
jgi:2-phospho-L-lactate guanylyltransferase